MLEEVQPGEEPHPSKGSHREDGTRRQLWNLPWQTPGLFTPAHLHARYPIDTRKLAEPWWRVDNQNVGVKPRRTSHSIRATASAANRS